MSRSADTPRGLISGAYWRDGGAETDAGQANMGAACLLQQLRDSPGVHLAIRCVVVPVPGPLDSDSGAADGSGPLAVTLMFARHG